MLLTMLTWTCGFWRMQHVHVAFGQQSRTRHKYENLCEARSIMSCPDYKTQVCAWNVSVLCKILRFARFLKYALGWERMCRFVVAGDDDEPPQAHSREISEARNDANASYITFILNYCHLYLILTLSSRDFEVPGHSASLRAETNQLICAYIVHHA